MASRTAPRPAHVRPAHLIAPRTGGHATRFRWWAAVVALVMLAGCADPPAAAHAVPTTAPDPVQAGSLDVVVTDPTLRPLPGALVRLSTNATAVTDDAGLARFAAVPTGQVLVTVELDGHRRATSGVMVLADQRVELNVKMLPSQQSIGPTNETRQEQFHLRGYFDCSATYLIVTGDCMLIVDTVTAGTCTDTPVGPQCSPGLGTPAGDATSEEFMLDFPLDHGWQSIVGEMHWEPSGAANGEQMTFALEPTEYNGTGHAPKYARSEGGSPLGWVVHAGEPHRSATASADGDEPDMPNAMGGEVVRTRSYVAGQFLHRPAGTTFLGVGAAVSQEFEVLVTVFYGERAPDDATVR